MAVSRDRFFGLGDTSGFWPMEATLIGGLGLISGRPVVEVERTGGTGRCCCELPTEDGSGVTEGVHEVEEVVVDRGGGGWL